MASKKVNVTAWSADKFDWRITHPSKAVFCDLAGGLGCSKADQRCQQTEDEVAGQASMGAFHSLSRSWLRLFLCEDDTAAL